MRIAIIEDEQPLAYTLKKGFESEEHKVELFFDAASAKYSLGQSRLEYDLIILDLMLPDGYGGVVCSYLRAAGLLTPILVLTARDSTEDKVDLLDRGADDFMSKPFSFEELYARSRALVRRKLQKFETETIVGDIRIVPIRRTVYRAGKLVPLTTRESNLLLYLILNLERVVSRSELFKNVLGQEGIASTNLVDVHIWNMRKKLDGDHDKKYIQTIHGSGYVFTA